MPPDNEVAVVSNCKFLAVDELSPNAKLEIYQDTNNSSDQPAKLLFCSCGML